MDDFESLLGTDEPVPEDIVADRIEAAAASIGRKRGGRPSNEERAARAEAALADAARQAEIRRAGAGNAKIKVDELKFLPVSQNWLAEFFNMDPVTVRKRLAKCTPAGSVGGGRPVYLFHEAVPFLIKPKWDIGAYIRTLNPAELPNSISKVYWEAERIKNKTLIETGEAWPTAKVLDVLGDVFMMIKNRMPVITEEMRDAGLNDDQLETLQKLTDQFQADLHASLVEMPARRQSYSRLYDIDPGDEAYSADAEDEIG